MTNAEFTGPTALPENLRVVSVHICNNHVGQEGGEAFVVRGSSTSVTEAFASGEDRIVLPEGTDLSQVNVTADWLGHAWGLRISDAARGGPDVFLRWGWEFNAAEDLAVAGEAAAEDAAREVPVEAEAPAEPVAGPVEPPPMTAGEGASRERRHGGLPARPRR